MGSLYRAAPQTDAPGQSGSSLGVLKNDSFYRNRVKPIIDRVGAAVLMVTTSPLTLISMLAVWVSLGRPVVYKQKRVGLDGKTFEIYKLRTMIPDRRGRQGDYVGPERRQTHKSLQDPRVPTTGRLLRQVRFDELPQLWNVVKGDMSLVGPRPELPEIVAEYDDWQHARHQVKPGLTGPWQVSDHNGEPMHECTEIDLEYVADISFRRDLSILVRTPAAMLHRRGY
jgi:lipopolysaccharide/colanic/teichoic acid biosynthesis glycosyltransferase